MTTKVVYFAERDGRIKIGCSGDAKSRVRKLRANLLGAFPGDFKDERATHARFADHRIEGEWFADTGAIRAFIAGLPALAPPNVLSLGEAATLLGVAPSTVAYWADRRLLTHFRTPGGHRRFLRSDVEKLRDQEPAA